MRSRVTPAASQTAARSSRKRPHILDDIVIGAALRSVSSGRPRRCISTRRRARRPAAASPRSSRSADTSLTMRAPASRPARATEARRVSIETTTSCRARPSTTGRMRRSSSSGDVGCEPGRVELAPDIDDVGALGNKTQAIFDGLRGVEAFTAVGKGIGRHVDDRHHLTRAIERRGRRKPAVKRPAAARDWRRPAPGLGAGRHRGAATTVGTGARAAGIVAHDLLAAQDRADLVVAQRLVLEQRLGDRVQVVEMRRSGSCRALPSASSIRRRTSWSISCAVASETFWVCVTAWPRKTSCSFAW